MKQKKNRKWFGECRVCGIEQDLCVAHLLPDGLKMLVENMKVQGSTMATVSLGESRIKAAQTLPFDKKIICAECDSKFGEIDRKFIAIVKAWTDLASRKHSFFTDSLPYSCSLPASATDLWLGIGTSLLRFSYSTDFPHIQLGPHDEAALLRLIQKGDPSDKATLNLTVRVVGTRSKITEGDVDLTRILSGTPVAVELGDETAFAFDLCGLTILCKIGTQAWLDPLPKYGDLDDAWGHIAVPMLPLKSSLIGMTLADVATHHFDKDASQFLDS